MSVCISVCLAFLIVKKALWGFYVLIVYFSIYFIQQKREQALLVEIRLLLVFLFFYYPELFLLSF
jgi:hypothetical protein